MVTIKIVLRKTKLTNNKYPIYLRVTYMRKSKFFRTPFNSSLKEWNEKTGEFNSKNDNTTQNNRVLNKYKSRVLKIINDFDINDKDFSFTALEKELTVTTNPLTNNVFSFWSTVTREMIDSGRIGTAKINKETYDSLKMFNNNSVALAFEELNSDFLYKYEVFLRKRGGTDGGIGVKMRAIRANYNLAINRGLTKESNYPFKTYKLSKLKGKALKRALDIEDINKIINYDLYENPRLKNAQNYFSFSFYTRGMNFVDMMLLENKHISKDKISYIRSKTGFHFNIKILPPVREILDYYKKDKTTETKYVFPILLKNNLKPNQIENRKHKVLKGYNKDLRELANLCGVTSNLTSYVARHSFANYMMQNGASTEIIRDSLGHQELSTTKSYLKELGSSVVDDACDLLLQF
ncbi:site-specific integrase [Cellulophaga sp. HaHaR_3_176]|uniref:site-specific integrase n=1 Tax=Cellulophaga sp. HaHaR_3_176 TaxID=1942464 RepID=UPI001C1FB022|nr:site-specific integrase [Cellulophaga sp. HaHaR_3_176]QWX83563.1 site-specific integrase [Cellulophaga sp. HaHaR_3_176]